MPAPMSQAGSQALAKSGISSSTMPWFSTRLPGRRTTNRLARVQTRLKAAGTRITDLTESNPTRAGLTYPVDMLESLGRSSGLTYAPEPLGLRCAREAVSAYLERLSINVESSQIVLTTATSEAYSMLFKLLCDPGQEVAVPQPSYPLFEHLTRLEAVRAVPYSLEFHGRWAIDLESLRTAVTTRTRAVLLVSPNNPTGSFTTVEDLRAVTALCHEHGLALIADEVFGVYPHTAAARGPSVLDEPAETLTFVLGGLSKAVGLPQLKLSWTVVDGPENFVRESLDRLSLICDTYLSVSTPVQRAVGDLLDRGSEVTIQIATRVRDNYARLQRLARQQPATTLLPTEGGWYAVVQVPSTKSEEALTLELLEDERILVYPGYFFNFPREAFLVLSLLPEPTLFERAAGRVLAVTAAAG